MSETGMAPDCVAAKPPGCVAAEPDGATVAGALRSCGLDPVDARILLQHALQASHARLIAHPERLLDATERAGFAALAERRRQGEPVAYLVGSREFYGRPFAVAPAVLIPRPETELLVDLVLSRVPAGAGLRILDLGTGSGSIAITLGLERPASEVVAVDNSPAALAIAARNARSLGADNVRLIEGSWYAPVAGRGFDLIVSNPPYVADGDPHLSQGDVRFEPAGALKAGSDGLRSIREIVAAASVHLQAAGWLLFEHGYDQGPACRRLLSAAGFDDIFTAVDLAGLPRVSGGRRAAVAAASARALA